jgi:hypothetical protein
MLRRPIRILLYLWIRVMRQQYRQLGDSDITVGLTDCRGK